MTYILKNNQSKRRQLGQGVPFYEPYLHLSKYDSHWKTSSLTAVGDICTTDQTKQCPAFIWLQFMDLIYLDICFWGKYYISSYLLQCFRSEATWFNYQSCLYIVRSLCRLNGGLAWVISLQLLLVCSMNIEIGIEFLNWIGPKFTAGHMTFW